MAKKLFLGMLLLGMTSVSLAAPKPNPIVTDIVDDACNAVKEFDPKQADKAPPVCQALYKREYGSMTAPEMDPSSAIAGLTLLLGGLAVIRGRRMTTLKGAAARQ